MYSRKVDELGRVVLPQDMRNELNINAGDEVSIEMSVGSIVMNKPIPGCLFCNAAADLVGIGKHHICRRCIDRLAEAKNGEVLYIMPID